MSRMPWPELRFYLIVPSENGLTYQHVATVASEYYATQIRMALIQRAPKGASIMVVRGDILSLHLGLGGPTKEDADASGFQEGSESEPLDEE